MAEFSLAALLKDLLPASQYIANVKMKPDETRDVVEFAVKLQNDVLCPIDSHWPIEKYKAIDEAYQKKDKDALAEARHDLAAGFRAKAKKVSENILCLPRQQILRLFMLQQKVCTLSLQVIVILKPKNY